MTPLVPKVRMRTSLKNQTGSHLEKVRGAGAVRGEERRGKKEVNNQFGFRTGGGVLPVLNSSKEDVSAAEK
jgi:hypothetical protein